MKYLSVKDEALLYASLLLVILCLEFGMLVNPPTTAHALDNSMKFTNMFGAELTNQPVFDSVFFAPGEITPYCRPIVVPSDTNVDVNPTDWQCTPLSRWRDATASRSITAVSSGYKTFTLGSNGFTKVNVSPTEITGHPIATVTTDTPTPTPHGLVVGDRVQYQYGTMNNPSVVDTGIVYSVPDTNTFKYISRSNTSGTPQNTGSASDYTTGATITNKFDPNMGTTTCLITSPNHDMLIGEVANFSGMAAAGITISAGTHYVTKISRNQFTTSGTCTGTYTSGASFTGPARGSVKQALWGVTTRVPNPGNIKVLFTSSTTPCSSGNQAACDLAGFDEGEMLAYKPDGTNDWNFRMRFTFAVRTGTGTVGTSVMTADARTILTAGDFTVPSYCGNRTHARGPVFTYATIEAGCAGASTPGTGGFDVGKKILPGTSFTQNVSGSASPTNQDYTVASVANAEVGMIIWTSGETMTITAVNPGTCTAPCLTVTRATTWTATARSSGFRFGYTAYEDATSDAYLQLHPRFDMWFFNNRSGVRADLIVENLYYGKISNQWYQLDLQTGPTPSTRLSTPVFKHTGSTKIKFQLYDGTNYEHFCCGGSGTDPDNCGTTGGGTRTLKLLVDMNTPYKGYAGIIPNYRMFTSPNGLGVPVGGFNGSDKGAITTI